MPVHDWTQVDAGTFHHFHNAWIQELCAALNGGVLPEAYYAISEQASGGSVPDILTLHAPDDAPAEDAHQRQRGGRVATLETSPPQVQFTAELPRELYLERQKRVAIRSAHRRDLVAVVEIVSPGNKSSQARWDEFLEKMLRTLRQGAHVLIIDLWPPTRRDPGGVHGALWEYLGEDNYLPPAGKPLTLASYCAGESLRAFVEPLAVGDVLAEMPVFLTAHEYVATPLETTYLAALERVPRALRGPLTPGIG